MRKENFRNIAIIAHVDHGKTTLVDGMLRQSGIFRENQALTDRVMDNMDLERERGITISAKNTAIEYNGVKINIIDTPGHADFGGEVERGLNLVDGAMLLVDASEGPLPQTRFVVKKALEKDLRIILVINKIDRPDSRIAEVIDEVFDLFIDLDATEEQIDFPILYTIAKDGVAHTELEDGSTDLRPLFDTIIDYIQGPEAIDDHVPQFLIANLDYDAYVGQIAIGRLKNGVLKMGTNYLLAGEHKQTPNVKFSALYTFEGLRRQQVEEVEAGDIIALAGIDTITIGDTITSVENPALLPRIHVDEPTVSMIFYVNTSPFAGQDGKYLTSRHILARLEKEMRLNVALQIEQLKNRADAFEVRGRGELQMAVLIETMRREGYEFMVSKPRVITKEIDGKVSEPVEMLYLDIPEDFVGVMSEKLSVRKGRMVNIINHGSGRVNLEFRIPSRGLIGFRTTFMTDTKGAGVMNTIMEGYEPWFGPIPQRNTGALVSDRPGKVTAYASLSMEDRGELQIEVGTHVYGGMVIGERNRPGDLDVNITREKKLTNMRSANADATVTLRKPHLMTLDESIEFISENELVEITPDNIRIRKMELDPQKRLSQARKEKRTED
ncbi:MAG: translational GTPase TypA [Candidatus Marinimicrobia bacterium]|jgi:GTP-binding protein|nr:translational GTPase TypA [Candidatus Neomarinimicrobiota bacterium]MBT3575122.1 translational GTPase TypA [Candidatus Neomarinimicrobiota bacterium]MBT3678894.1 translational GTPase TypA [Candidatus Neomarinimicrobiota bacterium]MBT3950008.1 translational GTPase TypA [Candidatus Neomarinimicrobiota bacterium]MBT4252711.1 translational GTPase TypA [Candidatus Neomarinimicrobiota bacterium]